MARQQVVDMLAYGTRVVSGVSPGKGGADVEGVPVFDTVQSAINHQAVDLSMVFVSAARTKDAVCEALECGIRRIVCVAEFMPVHDVIAMLTRSRTVGAVLVGPNSSGLISPGEAKAGFYCDEVCLPGRVGVITKSGTLSYAILVEMKKAGIGASTVVGVGGDDIRGTTFCDCIEMFEKDDATDIILMIGEIGGEEEEKAAEYIKSKPGKPVVAFIAGKIVPPGKSIGHAGAMVIGARGSHESKIRSLEAARVRLAETIDQVPEIISDLM
jgi:succinyl-CoA synthetase alpha subunit